MTDETISDTHRHSTEQVKTKSQPRVDSRPEVPSIAAFSSSAILDQSYSSEQGAFILIGD